MKLFLPIALNCLLVTIIYLVDKHTALKKLPYAAKQIIIGLLFGVVSSFASSYGVSWLGTTVNVRDASPLAAGLIFGSPAGIIAGFIGGTYRWLSVAWGAGTYTRLACTLATILAGFMAAAVRKYMFDNKKPTWGYGVCVAVVCEVVHMMLILLTNMNDSSYAFSFVKGASVPMILGNALAVGVSLVIVSFLNNESRFHKKDTVQIAQTFQKWLLACIVLAYCATTLFTFILQNGIAHIESREVFDTAIDDVRADVRGKSDDYMIDNVRTVAEEYESGDYTTLAELAEKNNVIEINIISPLGLITDSTVEENLNSFNMNDTDQSRNFFNNVKNNKEYVQEYGPIGRDKKVMRKYAGKVLANGEILQIGYNTDQFHMMLDTFVIDVTKNRSVGSNGFVAVCDENFNLVTHNHMHSKHVSTIGLEPNKDNMKGVSAGSLCEGTVVDPETGESATFIYAFTFVEGYCMIAAMPKDEAMFMRDASIYNSVFMQVLIFAVLFVFIYILIKRVIINNLKRINSTLAQIAEGNLNVTVNVRSSEEFASLSDDINSTVATLKNYIADAAARIDKELEYAKQIQLSALPTNFHDSDEYSIFAQMIAAKEVGGDFYDFYKTDENSVAFLVADVSGKGIPAAMFMMTAKTIIKDLAENGMPVNEILTKTNEKLCENNESGMFVTAWMGILDLASGKLTYANAGHNPPIIKRADGNFEALVSRPGFVLAGMEGVSYRLNELQLNEGDRIFLYTDGVTEATNAENKLYGEERLIDYLNRNQTTKATDLLPGLKADIDSFVGEAPQFDDITMLIFDCKSVSGEGEKITRTFPAETEALNDVISFIEETLEGYDCPMKTCTAICVAVEELFVNVAHYAYGEGKGDVRFTLSFNNRSRTVTFEMADSGSPFDPLQKPDPDISLSAEDRQIGGLGIFIVKKTMDSIVYSYENGENILIMKKTI